MDIMTRIKELEREVNQLKGIPEPYGYNGNSEGCDNMDGPCACGAWHTYDSPPPNLTERGKQALRDRRAKERKVLDKLVDLL